MGLDITVCCLDTYSTYLHCMKFPHLSSKGHRDLTIILDIIVCSLDIKFSHTASNDEIKGGGALYLLD